MTWKCEIHVIAIECIFERSLSVRFSFVRMTFVKDIASCKCAITMITDLNIRPYDPVFRGYPLHRAIHTPYPRYGAFAYN